MRISWRVDYYKIVKNILSHPEFIRRKDFQHHDNISVYDHCLAVSKLSYKLARQMNLDYKSAAIGGLLHDFYEEPWQNSNSKEHMKLLEKHGFTHAKNALFNSHKYFPELMNEKIDDIILRHMFPLNKIPPKYKEGWIVTVVDKYISLEVFKNPKFLPKLLGLRK